MGDTKSEGNGNESPAHQVTLKTFPIASVEANVLPSLTSKATDSAFG